MRSSYRRKVCVSEKVCEEINFVSKKFCGVESFKDGINSVCEIILRLKVFVGSWRKFLRERSLRAPEIVGGSKLGERKFCELRNIRGRAVSLQKKVCARENEFGREKVLWVKKLWKEIDCATESFLQLESFAEENLRALGSFVSESSCPWKSSWIGKFRGKFCKWKYIWHAKVFTSWEVLQAKVCVRRKFPRARSCRRKQVLWARSLLRKQVFASGKVRKSALVTRISVRGKINQTFTWQKYFATTEKVSAACRQLVEKSEFAKLFPDKQFQPINILNFLNFSNFLGELFGDHETFKLSNCRKFVRNSEVVGEEKLSRKFSWMTEVYCSFPRLVTRKFACDERKFSRNEKTSDRRKLENGKWIQSFPRAE